MGDHILGGNPINKVNPLPVNLDFNPVGDHTELAINTAKTLTPASGATKLLIQAITQNLRYTLDGTTPTTTKGFRLVADTDPLIIPVGADTVVMVIEEAATCDFQYQWGQ
jgi:hypothetical protein